MACYTALIDLSPSEFSEVLGTLQKYGNSLGNAGSTHGAGAPRGSNAKAHLSYFNGLGLSGSRDDAMTGYYYSISKDNFQKLLDWLIDGDHYKRVRNLTTSITSLAVLQKPTSLAAVERYAKDWPNPLKVEIYPRYF
ncbi:MAG: hypothetical protein NE330_16710 [Lentisphaeraceae bacterium]|nr:hypothetical protein [Lentisphaeraceae bacterium]